MDADPLNASPASITAWTSESIVIFIGNYAKPPVLTPSSAPALVAVHHEVSRTKEEFAGHAMNPAKPVPVPDKIVA